MKPAYETQVLPKDIELECSGKFLSAFGEGGGSQQCYKLNIDHSETVVHLFTWYIYTIVALYVLE